MQTDVMDMPYQPSGQLDRTACYGLLATQTLGRLVFTQHALPDVLPAHYHLDGENLLIRLALGSAAAVASRDAVVAFEADHFDPVSGTGWSVTIVGQARELGRADQDGVKATVRSWAGAEEVTFLRVPADRITGHRLVVRPLGVQSIA